MIGRNLAEDVHGNSNISGFAIASAKRKIIVTTLYCEAWNFNVLWLSISRLTNMNFEYYIKFKGKNMVSQSENTL